MSKTSDFNFHPWLNSIIFLQLPAPSKNFTRKNAKSIHRSTNHARSENFENALFLLFLHIPNKIIHSARFKIHPFQKIPIPNIYIYKPWKRSLHSSFDSLIERGNNLSVHQEQEGKFDPPKSDTARSTPGGRQLPNFTT